MNSFFPRKKRKNFEKIKMVKGPFILISEFQISLRHGDTFFVSVQSTKQLWEIITHPFGKNETMPPIWPASRFFPDVYGWLGSSTCFLITSWREVCLILRCHLTHFKIFGTLRWRIMRNLLLRLLPIYFTFFVVGIFNRSICWKKCLSLHGTLCNIQGSAHLAA